MVWFVDASGVTNSVRCPKEVEERTGKKSLPLLHVFLSEAFVETEDT